MNDIITGKMKYNDEKITILTLNNKEYDDKMDFHIKDSSILQETLNKKKNYLSKISFYLVSSFNRGEASFIYENDYIYFFIYNVEVSIKSSIKKRGISLIYDLSLKKLLFKDKEVEAYFISKYNKTYELKSHILDEIELLLLRQINEIYFKHSILDIKEDMHIFEVKGNYSTSKEILINLYDITKEENLITKAFQAEKLQALGNMSGAIAHELNNQLMAIDGNIELCLKNLNVSYNSYLDNALKASELASGLIKSLLSYSNNDSITFDKIYIDNLYNELYCKMNLSLNKDVEFIKNEREDMSKVYIYGSLVLLTEALNNIIINAIESFDKSDHILIMNSKVIYLNTCPNDVVNYTKHISGKYLQIDFIDNGCGIEYDIINRIFDPFYTTKDKSSSSGLGLTQTLGTIIKHNGLLSLKSATNIGSTFTIYLPCKEDKTQLSFDLFVSKAKILAIDDDEIVINVLELLLKDLGYDVIPVKDPFEALSFFVHNKNNIDLVLCDMIMPKMNGKELYYKLKSIKKDLKFILLSGYTKNNLDDKFLNEINVYLQKPIRKDILEKEIEKCLK